MEQVTFGAEEFVPTLVDFNEKEFPRRPKFDTIVAAEKARESKDYPKREYRLPGFRIHHLQPVYSS